jgi:hypothetical protein
MIDIENENHLEEIANEISDFLDIKGKNNNKSVSKLKEIFFSKFKEYIALEKLNQDQINYLISATRRLLVTNGEVTTTSLAEKITTKPKDKSHLPLKYLPR